MKICLIGSVRFREDYERINRILTLSGHVVYSVACFNRELEMSDPKAEVPAEIEKQQPLTADEKESLDLVHLKKIVESEAVLVVGEKDGQPYVGDSTRRELKWAVLLGKEILVQRDLSVGHPSSRSLCERTLQELQGALDACEDHSATFQALGL